MYVIQHIYTCDTIMYPTIFELYPLTVEEPPVEEPETEEPKTEEPPVEEPKTEEPPVEEPKTEEPPVEEPPVEEPKTEEPPVEEPKTEEPPVEEPKTEEPPVEEPKTEEPPVEEPKTEEPPVEEPKAEEPKTEEPPVVEPETEEPKPEEPPVAEPKVEEPPVAKPRTKLYSIRPDDPVDICMGDDPITKEDPITIGQLFRNVKAKFGNSPALAYKEEGAYKFVSYNEYYNLCVRTAKSFLKVFYYISSFSVIMSCTCICNGLIVNACVHVSMSACACLWYDQPFTI